MNSKAQSSVIKEGAKSKKRARGGVLVRHYPKDNDACVFVGTFQNVYLRSVFDQMSALKRSGAQELIALRVGSKSIISRKTLCISILSSKFFCAK